jgi:hypothetical protein
MDLYDLNTFASLIFLSLCLVFTLALYVVWSKGKRK